MVIIIAMALGAVTPPVGVTLYIAMGIGGVRLSEVNRYIWPFVAVLFVVLLLVAYIPPITTIVPAIFLGR